MCYFDVVISHEAGTNFFFYYSSNVLTRERTAVVQMEQNVSGKKKTPARTRFDANRRLETPREGLLYGGRGGRGGRRFIFQVRVMTKHYSVIKKRFNGD